jgi:hypothetical protein
MFTGPARQKPPAKWQDLGHFPPLCVAVAVAIAVNGPWLIITISSCFHLILNVLLCWAERHLAPKEPQAMLPV